jgi:hypothetical protein
MHRLQDREQSEYEESKLQMRIYLPALNKSSMVCSETAVCILQLIQDVTPSLRMRQVNG